MQTPTSTSVSTQGWLTRDQILQLHNQNSSLVDSIIQAKRNEGLFREHPDLPNDAAMTLYWVS